MHHNTIKSCDDRGRATGRFEFAAPCDGEAEGAACVLPQTDNHELWCGRRWIRTWPSLGHTGGRTGRPRRPGRARSG